MDIEPSASGYDVGWVAPGEWLNYSVNVASAGSYTAQFRVASLGQGGTFHLEMNGVNVTGTMTVPNTGAWQTWQTLTTTITLAAGAQTARLVMDGNGSTAVGNFDWMQFTATTAQTTGASAPAAPNTPNAPDGASDVTVSPNLSWKSSNASSRRRLGTSNPPPTVVSNTTTTGRSPTLSGRTKLLDRREEQRWRHHGTGVVVHDCRHLHASAAASAVHSATVASPTVSQSRRGTSVNDRRRLTRAPRSNTRWRSAAAAGS